jgi:hypothetical protein
MVYDYLLYDYQNDFSFCLFLVQEHYWERINAINSPSSEEFVHV